MLRSLPGLVWLPPLLIFLFIGCAEDPAESADSSEADASTDIYVGEDLFNKPGTAEPDANVPIDFGVAIEMVPGQIQSAGQFITTRKYIPEGCNSATPCPGVVLVPDLLMGGDEFFGDDAPKWLAARSGVIVMRYNPLGRGIASDKSSGEEDFNGTDGQDALRDVINSLSKNFDTTDQIGVISFGFGLSAAAGALGRFQPTSLSEVDFLIDIEGPVNRCFITAHAAGEEFGFLTGDGEGITDKRCDFNLAARTEMFPVNIEGAPPSVICNAENFTGQNCADDQWWKEREPKEYLRKLQGSYLRMQMQYDHEQASRWSALVAIKYVIQSDDLDYHQLNNVDPCSPLHTTGDKACGEGGCYLDYSAEGLGNSVILPRCEELDCKTPLNPFAEPNSDYLPLKMVDFFSTILPQYVDRMTGLSSGC